MKKIYIETIPRKRISSLQTQKAELVLLGLTPGRQQHDASKTAKRVREWAFKGFMRKQMYEWFISLGVAKYLKLEGEDDLFTKRFQKTVYMTSLLRMPVYVGENRKNYTGRSPYPWKHEKLKKLMNETLNDLNRVKKPALLVPMGQIVSKAIKDFSLLDEKHFILHGFPHPSGANGHRHKEFSKNKQNLKKIIEDWIKFKPLFAFEKSISNP